jgi:hypothetical protein
MLLVSFGLFRITIAPVMRDKARKPAAFWPGRFQRADGRKPASNVDIFLNTSRELMRDEQGRPFLYPATGTPIFGDEDPRRPYMDPDPATGRPWVFSEQ